MMAKRLLILFSVTALLLSGCINDDDGGSKSDKVATAIGELSMGGGVILFGDEGYALVKMATVFDKLPM